MGVSAPARCAARWETCMTMISTSGAPWSRTACATRWMPFPRPTAGAPTVASSRTVRSFPQRYNCCGSPWRGSVRRPKPRIVGQSALPCSRLSAGEWLNATVRSGGKSRKAAAGKIARPTSRLSSVRAANRRVRAFHTGTLMDGQFRTPHQAGIQCQVRNQRLRHTIVQTRLASHIHALHEYRGSLDQVSRHPPRRPGFGVDPNHALYQSIAFLPRCDLENIEETAFAFDRARVTKLIIRRRDGNGGRGHPGRLDLGRQIAGNHLLLDGSRAVQFEHLVLRLTEGEQAANRAKTSLFFELRQRSLNLDGFRAPWLVPFETRYVTRQSQVRSCSRFCSGCGNADGSIDSKKDRRQQQGGKHGQPWKSGMERRPQQAGSANVRGEQRAIAQNRSAIGRHKFGASDKFRACLAPAIQQLATTFIDRRERSQVYDPGLPGDARGSRTPTLIQLRNIPNRQGSLQLEAKLSRAVVDLVSPRIRRTRTLFPILSSDSKHVLRPQPSTCMKRAALGPRNRIVTATDATLVLAMDGPPGRIVHEIAPQRSQLPALRLPVGLPRTGSAPFDLPLHRRSLQRPQKGAVHSSLRWLCSIGCPIALYSCSAVDSPVPGILGSI